MNERVELAVEIPAQPRCKNLEPWTKNKVRAQRKLMFERSEAFPSRNVNFTLHK